jgi:hypothetical protein
MGRKITGYKKGTDARYVLGVDVARLGLDRTVFYLAQVIEEDTYRCVAVRTNKKNNLIESADAMVKLFNDYSIKPFQVLLNIDDTGVGGGLTDIMRERGWKVNPINFGNKAADTKKYDNISSEMWFRMRDVLKESSLPDNDHLRAELSGRQWKMDKKERRCIEQKEIFKKRFGKSPDLADACILAHYDKRTAKKRKALSYVVNLVGYN